MSKRRSAAAARKRVDSGPEVHAPQVRGRGMDFEPEPFRASALLRGTHLQTICGRLLRREPPLPFRRERLDTPDGDFVDLDFPELGVAEAAPGRR